MAVPWAGPSGLPRCRRPRPTSSTAGLRLFGSSPAAGGGGGDRVPPSPPPLRPASYPPVPPTTPRARVRTPPPASMGASTNARDRAIAGRSTIRTPEKRSSDLSQASEITQHVDPGYYRRNFHIPAVMVAGATGKPTIDAYKSFIYKGRESAEPFALHMLISRKFIADLTLKEMIPKKCYGLMALY
uniref:Uncharacterized protein n=1 Tax=Oryza barthii TaxID=65489 RepID=A0A0D3HMA6_9ORYZ